MIHCSAFVRKEATAACTLLLFEKRTKKEYDLTELYEVSESIYGLNRAMENTKITQSVHNFGVNTWIGLKTHSDPV